MKKLLLGTAMSLGMMAAASAADLGPAPAPIYTKAPLPAWSWTGFYLGLQGGAGWGTTEDSLTASQDCVAGVCGAITPVTAFPGLFRSSYGLNGLHGGGTAGFNWQAGPVVFGVEGDISAANIDGTGDCTSVFSGIANGVGGTTVASCHTKLTGFGTLTGRLGATIDHALVYIKAGGAWAHFNHAVMNGDNDTALLLLSSVGDNRSGFTVGTGIEYAVWGGWSAKVEYDYLDFGTKNLAFPFVNVATGLLTTNFFADDRERVHVVRAGLNYRFDLFGPRY